MKKSLTLFCVLLLCSIVFGETFTYTPTSPEVFTARDVSLSDNYIADYSTYFSLWTNPANIGLTGNKLLLPFVSANMEGDFADVVNIVTDVTNNDLTALSETLTTDDPIDCTLSLTGPLCLGAIKNNFGWGVFNRTYALTDILSPTSTTLYGGEQTIVVAGYAYPIKLPLNTTISVGFSGKGYADLQGYFEGSTVDAISKLMAKDYDFFPTYATLGFGLDAGATVSLFNVFVVSVSWQNLFAGTYSQKYDSFSKLTAFESQYDILSVLPLEDDVTLGIAINIPLKKATRGFITKSNLYANYSNFLAFFDSSITIENPLYYLTAGLEFEMFNTIVLRVGICEDHMSAGLGLNMGIITLDVAAYTQSLGLNPTENSQFGIALSLGTYY